MAKKTANPREKKLGESPGDEKMSRGILKLRLPIFMKISVSKSCDMRRGTSAISDLTSLTQDKHLTAVELRIGEESDKMSAVAG